MPAVWESFSKPQIPSDQLDIIAVLCSDIHLSHKPPVARSIESDWYAAMARTLKQLRDAAPSWVPIFCAGDVFDKWNSPPELINFALAELPRMFAIPGQHDLPLHNYADIKKSAFWTLVEAGKIFPIEVGKPVSINNMRLWGFPFGFPITPLENPHSLVTEIALIHSYIWTSKTGYVGAPKDQRCHNYLPSLRGYDVAVFGDNHQGFLAKPGDGDCVIINCGGLMRRKSDEISYEPKIGLLHSDGTVTRVKLDCSEDKFLDSELTKIGMAEGPDMSEFINELNSLQDASVNFGEAIKRVIEKRNVPESVRKIIMNALEEK